MPDRDGFDILISGGTLVDGTGKPSRKGDLGITGGRIVAMGDLSGRAAAERVDAAGKVVCPGFIDAHCHTDTLAARFPGAEGKILQGVTTDVCGLCGGSEAPIGSGHLEVRRRKARDAGYDAEPVGFAEYRDMMNTGGISTNMALFVGNANLRIHAIGYERRQASSREMDTMRGMLRESLEAGAFGLSTGLTYVPSGFADTEELVDLCRTVAPFGGVYNSHMRNEGDRVVESVAETIGIAEKSGCAGHVSHLKCAGFRNHGKAGACLELIDDANSRGVRMTFDVYPYTAGSINLSAVLPPWVLSADYGDDFSLLKERASLERIRADLERDDWENIVLQCGYSSIYIGDAAGRTEYEGRSLEEIALGLGIGGFEALIRVALESRGAATIVYHAMHERDLVEFMSHPLCSIGTDAYARHYAGPSAAGKPHPRNYGAFPRYFRRFVLDRPLFGIEEAVRKITSLPAQTFGMKGRGLLREGAVADVTVFDPATIRENGSYAIPNARPAGIEEVIVGGRRAVAAGKFADLRAGRVIRRV